MKLSPFMFSKPIIENLNYSVKPESDILASDDTPIPMKVETRVKLAENDNKAIVEIEIEVNSNSFPFNINLVLSTIVKWNGNIPEEMLESVLNKNIPATLLSYARPIISLITSYSNYKQFDLPFLDLRNSD